MSHASVLSGASLQGAPRTARRPSMLRPRSRAVDVMHHKSWLSSLKSSLHALIRLINLRRRRCFMAQPSRAYKASTCQRRYSVISSMGTAQFARRNAVDIGPELRRLLREPCSMFHGASAEFDGIQLYKGRRGTEGPKSRRVNGAGSFSAGTPLGHQEL